KINIDDIQPSTRRYPAIIFQQKRQAGDQILSVENLSYALDGQPLFRDLDFVVNRGDKIAFLSKESIATTSLFRVLAGELAPSTGEYRFGQTITTAYLPANHDAYFNTDENLIDWLRQ